MAGKSAEAVATRQRGAARLEGSAERSARGTEGQRVTAEALGALGEDWTVLHDLAWPGRSLGHIDHVVVGPPGVFVVDSLAWSGVVTTAGGTLRQNGRSRATAVTGVRDAARAVAGVVGSPAIAIISFASDAVAPTVVDGVLVVNAADVVRALTTFEPALTAERRAAVVAHLRAGSAAAATVPPLPAPAEPAPSEPAPVEPAQAEPAQVPAADDAATDPDPGPGPAVASAPARRSAPLVPAARLKRSSLPVGSSSSGTRSTTRRVLPRVAGGVLAAGLIAAMVVPVSRDWVSDRIYQMVSPDIPSDPGPVHRPAQDKKKDQDKKPGQNGQDGQRGAGANGTRDAA